MSRNYDKELALVDKLKHQNKKLKRELKVARKMLDRYNVAEEKGLIDEDVIVPGKKRNKEQELKDLWRCYECEVGVLKRINIGNSYFRICDKCGKHTKPQVFR